MAVPRHALLLLSFLGLALALTWPLPLHLGTHLTGAPTGDTGVYVWNVWIFRHELLRHAQWPLSTSHIFAASNGADLSVHNYTVFADLVALPLIGRLGVVATFNVIYIGLVATSGYAAFLLVRRLTGRTLEAWLSGALFAGSPFLIARGTAHFSLTAAAPLPIFVLCALRTLRTRRLRDAALTGLVMGWAGYCDVYYTIFCVLAGALLLAHHVWAIEAAPSSVRGRGVRITGFLILTGLVFIGWRLWYGEFSGVVLGRSISIRSLYTPVLAVTSLALVQLQLRRRFHLRVRSSAMTFAAAGRLGAMVLLAAAVTLLPVVASLGSLLAQGRFPSTAVGWRSSPPGLDVVDFLVPNPNHAWWGALSRQWIDRRGPLAFPEFVASWPLVALGVIAWAVWRQRTSIPRLWLGFTAAFGILALGPFVSIAGVNTYIPGPWALLRYVPVIGLARSPARFAILAMLGVSILFAFALCALGRAMPQRRRAALGLIAALLTLELWPGPRPLYSASVPSIYTLLREENDESTKLLELPGGVRDGTSSIGDFNASAQFYQTVHRKPLVGGYKSRVSEWRKQQAVASPVLAALYRLSEGAPLPASLESEARASRAEFLRTSCLGYVVVDAHRATPQLRSFAIELLDLVPVAASDGRELYAPARRTHRHGCRADASN